MHTFGALHAAPGMRTLPPPATCCPQTFVLRATLWAAEGEAGEAKTAHILQLAVEAATHGVLRYKSAQLLVRRNRAGSSGRIAHIRNATLGREGPGLLH